MKVLLYERESSTCARIEGMLRASGYEAVVAGDASVARDMLTHGAAVALLSARGADADVLTLVRETRKAPGNQPFIVLLIEDASEDFLTKAYEAGIDGDMQSPFGRAFLLARLRSASRFLPKEVEANPIARPAKARTPVDVVAGTKAFQEAHALFSAAASRFLTLPVSYSGAVSGEAKVAQAIEIRLNCASAQVEARIAIGVDARAARDLSVHMFGPEGNDLAADMLSELANILMGALKTGMSAESHVFAAGLPEPIDVERILRSGVTYPHQEAFSLLAGDARVIVHVGLQSKGSVRVGVGALREGMVIAKELFNPRGLMLVGAGTRLSATMIERLKGVLPPKWELEVMPS